MSGVHQPVGVDVRLDVMHGDQGDAQGVGQRLRRRDADQQRAEQSGPVGDGDGINVLERQPRLLQRLRDDAVDLLDVPRAATSGTTPPVLACRSICEAMTLDRISRPSRTTEAEVSSQEVSMPRMFMRLPHDWGRREPTSACTPSPRSQRTRPGTGRAGAWAVSGSVCGVSGASADTSRYQPTKVLPVACG